MLPVLLLPLWIVVRMSLNGWQRPTTSIIVGAVVYAIGFGWWAIHGRRADARDAGVEDADDLPALERRIRAGDLPTEPEERAAARVLVRNRLAHLRRSSRWLVPALWVVVLGISVTDLVLDPGPTSVAWVVGAAALLGWLTWFRRLSLRRFTAAERELADESARSRDAHDEHAGERRAHVSTRALGE